MSGTGIAPDPAVLAERDPLLDAQHERTYALGHRAGYEEARRLALALGVCLPPYGAPEERWSDETDRHRRAA